VADELKRERLTQVIELQRAITMEKRGQRLGCREPALVESPAKKNELDLLARTERDDMVVLRGERSLIGKIIEVELKSLSGSTFRGERV
jgi:tRNA-2-methylthio-N6-dimethylallyladenosine synthase